MTVDDSLTDALLLDRGGYPYVIHPLMDGVPRASPDLLRAFADWASAHPSIQEATVLLAPEAMALPLAAAVSLQTELPYLVVRKRRYDLPGEMVAYCETGYGENCLYINDLQPDDKIVIIDDVISTGGTLGSLLNTIAEMGHEVLSVLAFVDKGDKAEVLQEEHGVPIQAMRSITIADGKIQVDQ